MKTVKKLFLYLIFIYIGVGLYLYIGQRDFIYFPVRSAYANLEEQSFDNDGEKIKATILNKGKKKAIIYFGGNAENVEYNSESFSRIFDQYTVYLVKYRGYGGSTGEPTERGIYSDALHIYDSIRNAHEDVSVIGRSLGSAVATYVAANKEVRKLILITPFDSIQNVAQAMYPIYPMSILLKDKYDSLARVGDIKAQAMIIAAQEDEVINIRHTKRLVEEFPKDIIFHVIENVGHNNISNSPLYNKLLEEFMAG